MRWFFGAVVVSYLLTTEIARKSMLLYALFTLPGTILHELCHFVAGLVTFSHPRLPSLIPHREGNGWTLGSVEFIPGIFTTWFVALAPLWLMPTLAYLIFCYAQEFAYHYASHWSRDAALTLIILGWVESSIIFAAMPSRQDWQIAFSYPLGFVIPGGIAWYLYRFEQENVVAAWQYIKDFVLSVDLLKLVQGWLA